MRNQKSGIIVNMSSIAGKIGLPGSSAYISSKFALEGFSECLRYELGQFGIKTTLIEPGVIKTNFFEFYENTRIKNRTKIQRINRPHFSRSQNDGTDGNPTITSCRCNYESNS